MAYNGKMTWEVVETLADVEVNETNRLVVDVNKSSTGLVNIGIREFWTPDGDNWYPGKRGLALKANQWAQIAPAIAAWLENQDDDDDDATPVAPTGNGRKLGSTAKKAAPRKVASTVRVS